MKKLTYSLLLVVATIFSSYGVAKVQFIHNDTSGVIASIDLYVVSGAQVTTIDNFNFRTASTFRDVPHGNNLRFGIALPSSTGVGDTLVEIPTTFNLVDGTNYYIIFNNGNILLLSGFNLTSGFTGQINLAFHHGAHGVPGVDVQARGSIALNATLFNNVAPFSVSTTLISGLPTAAYDIRVADTSGAARLASVEVDLTSAGALPGGTSALAFASGALGATGTYAFGVFGVLPIDVSGQLPAGRATVITLPLLNSALVQVIHASPNADSVQVYVDTDIMGLGGFVEDSRIVPTAVPNASAFPYQGASRYLEVDWKTDANARVIIYDKTEVDQLFSKVFALTNGAEVIIVAGGPLASFDLYAGAGKRFTNGGPQSGFLGTTVFHGSPDAPAVDASIVSPAAAATSLGTDISFGEFAPYTEAPYVSSLYVAQVAATGGGATFRSTPLPLGLNPQANGLAFTLYVTGYINPSTVNNGPSLQLCAASLNGNPVVGVGNLCFDLVVFVSTEEKIVNKMIMYPNPTQGKFNVEYTLESAQEVNYSIINTMGQVVLSGTEGVQNSGRNAVSVDVANLSTGQYVIQMLIGSEVNVTRSFIKE